LPTKRNRTLSLFVELKRRNVLRTAAAYVVASWLVIQVVGTLFPAFGFSDAAVRIVTIGLAIGLIPALILSWAFEITPEGLKKEKDVDRSQSITTYSVKKLDRIIMVVLAFALGYFAFDKFGLSESREAFIAEEARQEGRNEALVESFGDKSIAVLPFVNMSDDASNEYFSDGISEELLNLLAGIQELRVISRTSAFAYKGKVINLTEVARELNVVHILEGSVRKAGNQVRITAQLIDARSDIHLWSETYDRELTTENLFAIQSEISQRIVDSLQATLTPEDREHINAIPTDNLVAYDAYLHGLQLIASRNSTKLEQATRKFNKAVELDPQFALAWVGVADSYALLASYGTFDQDESFQIRSNAIQNALEINDKLGHAYVSLGSLKFEQWRNKESEKAFQRAIELSPNYAVAYHWYGHLLSRFRLRVPERIALISKAAELDPGSSIIANGLGNAYVEHGLYTLALRQYQKVIELDPGFPGTYQSIASIYIFHDSQFDKALSFALQAQQLDQGSLGRLAYLVQIYRQVGDLAAIESIRERIWSLNPNHATIERVDMTINLMKENHSGMRDVINSALQKASGDPARSNMLGYFALSTGDIQLSRDIYIAANPGWLERLQWQGLIEVYETTACRVAWVLMNTSNKNLGEALLEQSISFLDGALSTVIEHVDRYRPETCYLASGDTDKALQSIETQLEHNHLFDWQVAHQMPMYDLIRQEPRYLAAFEERKLRIAEQRKAMEAISAEVLQ
jgi:TolB-like protein/Tfp pilus assembly protein PilF